MRALIDCWWLEGSSELVLGLWNSSSTFLCLSAISTLACVSSSVLWSHRLLPYSSVNFYSILFKCKLYNLISYCNRGLSGAQRRTTSCIYIL